MESTGKQLRLLKKWWRLLKGSVGAVATALLGVILILQGQLQSIVTGCGAILASIVMVLLIRWDIIRSDEATELENNPQRLIWLGIGLTIASGVVYLYLCYAMTHFDSTAVLFTSVPLLVAGLGCLGIGLWKTMQPSQGK